MVSKLRLYKGLRFPRLGFEIFRGLSGGWYVARLPVGLPVCIWPWL